MTSTRFSSSIALSLTDTAMLRRPVLILRAVLVAALASAACGGSHPAQEPGAKTASTEPDGEGRPVPPAGEAAGFESITSRSAGATGAAGAAFGGLPDVSPADGTAIQAPGLSFHLPADWRNEPPTSSMRLAQASIPGEAGDGQLAVFYFGPGGGGGVDANIDRWVGQVGLDPGTMPRRIRMDLESGLVAHWVEVEGTLQPSMMGTGPAEAQPNSRLQGAVVEGPQGPWFFKTTGPAATLDAQRDAFFAMLRSLRPSV